MRVKRARMRGTVERHSDAVALLEQPGDMSLVIRGVPRMLVFSCPDGCGDILPVNLDPRADKAWRYYERCGTRTLYPSVWRDEGCGAHFILWDDVIYWSRLNDGPTPTAILKERVFGELSASHYRSYFDIALSLDEIPWAVSGACWQLVKDGLAEERAPKEREGFFRRRA